MQLLSFIVIGLLISFNNGQKSKSKPSVNYLLNKHEDDESSGSAAGPSSFQFTGPNGNRAQLQSGSRFPSGINNNFADYDGGLSGQFGNRQFSPSQFGNGQSFGGSNIDYDDYPLVTEDGTRYFGNQGFQGGITPQGGFRGTFSPTGGFQNNFLPQGFSNGGGFGTFPQNGFSQNGPAFQQGFSGNQGFPSQQFPTQGFPNQGFPNQGFPNQGFPSQGFPNQGFPSQGFPNQGFPSQGFPSQQFPSQGFPNQGFANQGFPNQDFSNQGFNGGFSGPTGFNMRNPGGNQNNFGMNGMRSRQTDPDYEDFNNSLTPSWQNRFSSINPYSRYFYPGVGMEQRSFPAEFGRQNQRPFDDRNIARNSRNGRSDKAAKKTSEDEKDDKAIKTIEQ